MNRYNELLFGFGGNFLLKAESIRKRTYKYTLKYKQSEYSRYCLYSDNTHRY